MFGTFNIATESKAPSVDSTSRPSFNLCWPSSVRLIGDNVVERRQDKMADKADAATMTMREAAAKHGQVAGPSFPPTQPYEVPETMSQQGYSQLGEGQIRLLKLVGGHYEDDLTCELQSVDLSRSERVYEALSYTWADNTGDKNESESIHIAEWTNTLKITVNCANALRRLRHPTRVKTLWVDSICINQKSIEERSHQVSKMGHIYRAAERVLIYLGEDPKDPNPRKFTSWIYENYFNTMDLRTDFSTLPYFSRTWVIQEVANAGEAWCFYGSRGSKLNDLLHLNSQNQSRLNMSHPWVFVVTRGRLWDVAELLDLLLVTTACLASDPRDKVFALLGLLTMPEKAGLVADYGLSLAQVLIGVTAFTMQLNPCRTLSLVQPASSCRLPSWVVDWASTNFRNPRKFKAPVGHSASNRSKHNSGESRRKSPRPQFYRDGTLVLRGIPIANLSDCVFGIGAISGPPGVLTGIHHEPNYRPERRDPPRWAHESDKLFRVLGMKYCLILRPLNDTNEHTFIAICKRERADGMAHLLDSLDRSIILLVSAWNEILSNKNHRNWFRPQIWKDIKQLCALVESYSPRFAAADSARPESDELSGDTKGEKASLQHREDATRSTANCPERNTFEKVTLFNMAARLREERESGSDCKSNATDAEIAVRVTLPTTANSSPISTQPSSTPVHRMTQACYQSVVQACWDWRKVANGMRDNRDYFNLHERLGEDLGEEPGFGSFSGRGELFWHPAYMQKREVEKIFTRVSALLVKIHSVRTMGEMSSGRFLQYLISQTLSVKVNILDEMLGRECSNLAAQSTHYRAPKRKEEFYENGRVTLSLNWLKMSLNLDQSQPIWGNEGKAHNKPWAVSFLELWSQLELTGTKRKRQETYIAEGNGEEMRPKARTRSFSALKPAEGGHSREKEFEHDAWNILLELIDKTRDRLLPLETLFTLQGGEKTSSSSNEEGQWSDVYIA